MNKKYKAPKWFIKLFNEGMVESKKLEKHITGVVGYGKHWCEQNQERVNKMLTNEQKDKANEMMDRIETIKKYAWSKYFYENWGLVKSSIASPLSNVSYNDERQTITVSEPSAFKKAIVKAGEKLTANLLKNKFRKIVKKELKNKPK